MTKPTTKFYTFKAEDLIYVLLGFGFALPNDIHVQWRKKSVVVSWDETEVVFDRDGEGNNLIRDNPTITESTWAK